MEDTGPEYLSDIFSLLDKSDDGFIEAADLKEVLAMIGGDGDHVMMMELLDTQHDDHVSFEQFVQIITRSKERSLEGKIRLLLILYALPALYSACTRLPFIFLALEVTEQRNGAFWQVGVLLGAYQACRATANKLVEIFGITGGVGAIYPVLIIIGFTGWLVNLLWGTDSVFALFTLCGVGLSEAVVCLQNAVMAETRDDSANGSANTNVIVGRLRTQYTAVSFGAFVAFVVGGAM